MARASTPWKGRQIKKPWLIFSRHFESLIFRHLTPVRTAKGEPVVEDSFWPSCSKGTPPVKLFMMLDRLRFTLITACKSIMSVGQPLRSWTGRTKLRQSRTTITNFSSRHNFVVVFASHCHFVVAELGILTIFRTGLHWHKVATSASRFNGSFARWYSWLYLSNVGSGVRAFNTKRGELQ